MIGFRLISSRPRYVSIKLLRHCISPLPLSYRHAFIPTFKLESRKYLQTKQSKHEEPNSTPKAPPHEASLSKNAGLPPSKPKLDLSTEIYTIPNMLTISRIAATPFIGYFLATSQSVPAIAIFTYSCVTDFVDGYIARKYNMKSVLGSILDPAADKFLMTTCTVAMAVPGSMPLYVASTIIGRDVILSLIGFYVRYKALPPPLTIKRYFDMSITTHTVHPNFLGKANTALQMFYIGGLVMKPAIESFLAVDLGSAFDWFGMAVAASTICSGLSYLVGKNSFKAVAKPGL